MTVPFWVQFLIVNVIVGVVIAVVPGFLKSVFGVLGTLVIASMASDFFFDTPLVGITDGTALVTLFGPISLLEVGLVAFVVLVAIGGLIEG
jgi:hypothetical protein